jgi:hypothetical protein
MKIFMQTPFGKKKVLGNHTVSHMSYDSFLSNNKKAIDLIKSGFSGSSLYARLQNPYYLQKLYLNKDRNYFQFLHEFKDRYQDYNVIVMNPGVDLVHPEFLYRNFPNSLKCLHFIDDPHQTYNYGLPFSWAFDCATYISPSYSEDFEMSKLLKLAGFNKTKWFPHCITNINQPKYNLEDLEKQLLTRNNKVIYVGGFYTNKVKRLRILKNKLKNNMDIFGRYPFAGYSFPIISAFNGQLNMYRVRSITDAQREEYYSSYSIGLNMHLSEPSQETGNARLYELAYRGIAQVVDASKASLVDRIFKPEKEVLVYNSLSECVDQIRRLQSDEELRINIATNAYKRAITEYNYPNRLLNLFDWFKQLL